MKAVVRAVSQNDRQRAIGTLVEVVTELVMDRREILGVHVDAHLDAHVALIVDIPRARVADDFAIARLHEQRSLPECLWQRLESERGKESLPDSDPLARLRAFGPGPSR